MRAWLQIHSRLEQHLLMHLCLHALWPPPSWAKRKHVANRALFSLLKVETLKATFFEVTLTKNRQCFFFPFFSRRTKELQYDDRTERWDWRGRPPVIKFAYFIEEWAATGAGLRWKTLQLLIHPSTCSLSSVRFQVNSSCVRPGLRHTSLPLIYAHYFKTWFHCCHLWVWYIWDMAVSTG